MRTVSMLMVCGAALGMVACSGSSKRSDTEGTVAWNTASPSSASVAVDAKPASGTPDAAGAAAPGLFAGFDRNEYPGDTAMAGLRTHFTFTGYWVTVPPGAETNTWQGKRNLLRQQGWGFLTLANGKLEAEILKAQKSGTTPEQLGKADATAAASSARSEGFPAHTIVFLDQEEGGRLTAPQAAYLLAWTETMAHSDYLPGVYASGQRVQDGPGVFITTVQDIRDRVAKEHLHEVAIFDAQDQCPPAPGCTVTPKPLAASGSANIVAWQYAQSPRRPEITKSCAATYASDGNCYAPGFTTIFLDMDAASSTDPSHGR